MTSGRIGIGNHEHRSKAGVRFRAAWAMVGAGCLLGVTQPSAAQLRAAALATGAALAGDWQPADGHKMHFPQLPDEEGWDVNATAPMVLADDWRCSESGLVTDIHFWGSWRDMDGDGHGDPGTIQYFSISIHEDIPAGVGGIPYSRPGLTLRDWMLPALAVGIDPPTFEAWYDPSLPLNIPNDHQEYFQYNITNLDTIVPDPFFQTQGTIYWLNISAVLADPPGTREWGWKSSRDHFQDDAVWAQWGSLNWVEMYEPPRFNRFDAIMDPLGNFFGSGTNYYGLGWYFYEQLEPWWNIWFYDNPFTMEHMKVATINAIILPADPLQPSFLTLAVNWSTPEWSLEGNPPGDPRQPPLPGVDENLYIGRQIIWQGVVPPEGVQIMELWQSPYNPEWVSIDVQGSNFIVQNGTIWHECVQTSLDLAFVITGAGSLCPVPADQTWCLGLQARDCQTTSVLDSCLPRDVVFPDPTNPVIDLCDCFLRGQECGPVQLDPVGPGYQVSCPGPCPPGMVCWIHFDGAPTGSQSMPSTLIPPGTRITCACAATPTQACCMSDGTCIELTPMECQSQGGQTQGPGQHCTQTQACCLPDGTCQMVDPVCCDDLGGTALPAGSVCGGVEACCLPDDTCQMMDRACCEALGGNAQGPGSACTQTEACCMPDGTCRALDPLCCAEIGGMPQGLGTVCTQPAACCLPDGSCRPVDPLCCDDLGGSPPAGGSLTCLGDGNQNGVDDACESITQACCLPNGTCAEVEYNRCVALGGDPQGPNTICDMRVCNPLKWAQPPTYNVNAPGAAQCFWGWNDPSHYQCWNPPCQIVADDWACESKQPVTDIHWWGSYQFWTTQTPPPMAPGFPDFFHIGIWTDVPVNVDRPFSHPRTMVWEIVVPRAATNERYVGCDTYPGQPQDTCFRYDFEIPQEQWFYQTPNADPTIYWISISAWYPTGPPEQPYVWGWKTRRHFFNDDAVRIFSPSMPALGMMFEEGAPIETDEGSWDMAFVLTTRRAAGIKWEQWPNPTLPGLHAHDGITLAENWECQGGKVTDFHWWGNYELDGLGNEDRGAGINCINISIHRNQPGVPWCLPQDPELWGVCAFFGGLNEHFTGMYNIEGARIYQYDFSLEPGFAQIPGDIYWLNLEAVPVDPDQPAIWRWQEADRSPTVRLCPAAERTPSMPWHTIVWSLEDPVKYSELAFRVTSRPYPPDPDPTGVDKTRFISFLPGNAGQQTALMVTLDSLHHVSPPYTGGPAKDFTAWEGQVRWVGPPQQYIESTASGVLFWASKLQCEPYYQDWSTVGLLHVTGAEIIPSSQYGVQAVSDSCLGAETDCADVSTPLHILTTRWADVELPYNPPSPTTQPDLADVSALVNKFRSAPGAPIKARALLSGQVPEMSLDFSFIHISDCVDAFRGKPYPYAGPCACPSTVTCDATPCSTPSPCPAGQLCVAGFCRDACERCTP